MGWGCDGGLVNRYNHSKRAEFEIRMHELAEEERIRRGLALKRGKDSEQIKWQKNEVLSSASSVRCLREVVSGECVNLSWRRQAIEGAGGQRGQDGREVLFEQ